MESKANLFLVGAMKAGTTSLSSILDLHDDIYLSPIKEPHYFVEELPLNIYEPSRFFSEAKYFEKQFPEPLHIAHIKDKNNYERLFASGIHAKYRLDASTAYLHAPNVASKIKAYNPDAKIIIITRNPLVRAFSHYKMDRGLGRTSFSFEQLIQEEIEKYYSAELAWNSYLGMSFYKDAITEFQKLFTSVLVLDFDTFIKNKEQTLQDLASFLKLDSLQEIDMAHKNKTRTLRFQKLFYFLKKLGLKDYFSKILPPSFRQKLFGMVSTDKTETINLSAETERKAKQIFSKQS